MFIIKSQSQNCQQKTKKVNKDYNIKMASKITDSFRILLKRYRDLPYIAMKRHSKYYLIPHRVSKPNQISFKIVSKKIEEKTDKYSQYFSHEKLRIKQQKAQQIAPNSTKQVNTIGIQLRDDSGSSQIFNNKITPESLVIKQRQKYQSALEQYLAKNRQYNFKYKQPLQLIAINPYLIFLREQAQKVKAQKQKISSETNSITENNQAFLLKTSQLQKKKNGIQKSKANIQSMNKLKLSVKWGALTEQQKKVYYDMELKIKQENQHRIQHFIQNHEIPFIKRFSAISRFTMRYCTIYQLGIKDKKLYEIYHALPQSQKDMFKNEAINMNKQSKQRRANFLNKWNLSQEFLKEIIEVSIQYKKARSIKFRQTRLKNAQQKSKFYKEDITQEDLDQNDNQDQYS